jgi:hypothetical protein
MQFRYLAAVVLSLVSGAFALEGQIGIHDPSTNLQCDGKYYTYGTSGGGLISNAASVWRVNGRQVIGIFGDCQTVIDDGVSKCRTLNKGPNIVRCAAVNGG